MGCEPRVLVLEPDRMRLRRRWGFQCDASMTWRSCTEHSIGAEIKAPPQSANRSHLHGAAALDAGPTADRAPGSLRPKLAGTTPDAFCLASLSVAKRFRRCQRSLAIARGGQPISSTRTWRGLLRLDCLLTFLFTTSTAPACRVRSFAAAPPPEICDLTYLQLPHHRPHGIPAPPRQRSPRLLPTAHTSCPRPTALLFCLDPRRFIARMTTQRHRPTSPNSASMRHPC